MFEPGQHIHLVGIGGIGLSAIARVLLLRGCRVTGSDMQANAQTAALQALGATVYRGHAAEHADGADLVIISSAVPPDNPEVVAARARGVRVVERVDILADLMQGYTGVAVAGTHGKTTTTAMIVHLLVQTGRDPTYIVGGVVPTTGTNADVGQGGAFVIEADEYGHMFLGLRPRISVITSIEHDHPDMFPTLDALLEEFRKFAALTPPEGMLIVCADDRNALAATEPRRAAGWPVMTYGIVQEPVDWRAVDVRADGHGMAFSVMRSGQVLGTGRLIVPGVHNVLNALAALAVGDQLGVPVTDALDALASFRGAGRRFEVRGMAGGVTVIDDYAHHPTAIRLTLQAARAAYPEARIWAVWQPHTFSRLRALFDAFAGAFVPENVDYVLVTDVYAAREKVSPGPGVPELVARAAHPDIRHTPTFDDTLAALISGLQPGDVVLILSAGDAPQIGVRLLDALNS
ncbi:MAG: UDP-N-acetylmuramate--L-alanine ligase [Anaerolineae bacterium]